MKKFGKILFTTALVSSLIVTPVFATPSVDEITQDKTEAQSEVNSLQSELTSLLVKMDELESNMITTGQAITQAEGDLEIAQAKEEQQYEDMKLRIQYMFEEGNESFLEILLTSESISDMLNKAEYVQKINQYDRDALNDYIATKEEVANLKSSLEEQQATLEKSQTEYTAEQDSLNATLETKKAEVADFDAQLQAAAEAAAAARQAELNAQASAKKTTTSTKTNNTGSSNYTPPSNSGGGSAIVSAAYNYIGVDYVWGGASSNGVDCSGLVMLAHRAIGVPLDHSSGSQGGGGVAVSSPEPGDVVCYSGHVGIYIGGGQMIHAPTEGQTVCVTNVYGSPWYRRYW